MKSVERSPSEYLCEVTWSVAETFHAFTSRERAPARHVFFCWCTDETKDKLCLVEIAVTGKDRFALEHFSKNASANIRKSVEQVGGWVTYPTPHISIAEV
jgi:hypothetical protein